MFGNRRRNSGVPELPPPPPPPQGVDSVTYRPSVLTRSAKSRAGGRRSLISAGLNEPKARTERRSLISNA